MRWGSASVMRCAALSRSHFRSIFISSASAASVAQAAASSCLSSECSSSPPLVPASAAASATLDSAERNTSNTLFRVETIWRACARMTCALSSACGGQAGSSAPSAAASSSSPVQWALNCKRCATHTVHSSDICRTPSARTVSRCVRASTSASSTGTSPSAADCISAFMAPVTARESPSARHMDSLSMPRAAADARALCRCGYSSASFSLGVARASTDCINASCLWNSAFSASLSLPCARLQSTPP
mmetsp:Transcript_19789/g.37761  ORF Transcript_19789/g.37761 Transcript_19789/m.37761 type:complete len:246 (+) Transcript_19789:963-1700(+)